MDRYTTDNSNHEGKIKLKDNLGELIFNFYEESKDAYQLVRDIWDEASDDYNAVYPEKVGKVLAEAKKYEIFVQLTKRIVDNARAHLTSELFNDIGEVPFHIKPAESDLDDLQEPQKRMLSDAAKRMERSIRTDLHRTDYVEEVEDVIDDLALLGTGIMKNPVIKTLNYPVFQTGSQIDPMVEQTEQMIESQKIATGIRVSPRHIFPAPGAKSPEEADYIIHFIPKTALQLLKYVHGDYGYDKEAILDCLSYKIGAVGSVSEVEEDLVDPNKYDEQTGFNETDQYEMMEFWGRLQISKVERYIPEILKTMDGYYLVSPEFDKEQVNKTAEGTISYDDVPEEAEKLSQVVDVCISVLGNKQGSRVIRAALTPLDGIKPFDFCYWKKNNESIFGDGIHTALRDLQKLMNFFYAQIVDGKTLSGKPQVLRRENTFGGDDDGIWAGKEWVVKGTGKLEDHLDFFAIPDTTQGLEEFVDRLEREANLSTLSPMQGGDNSKYQTTTARGLQLLNENNRKDIVAVVRSISSMITRNIKHIYHWKMADSKDQLIKGNYDAQCTGFMDYINRVEKKNQLIQMTTVLMETPLAATVKQIPSARNLYEMSGLDADIYVKTEEEFQQEQQSQSQMQQQMLQTQMQMQQQMAQMQAMIDGQLARDADVRKEMMAASADERKRETLERVALLKEGNVLHPTSLEQTAMLLEEEQANDQAQQIQRTNQEEGQIKQLEQQEQTGQQVVNTLGQQLGQGVN